MFSPGRGDSVGLKVGGRGRKTINKLTGTEKINPSLTCVMTNDIKTEIIWLQSYVFQWDSLRMIAY